MAPIILVMSYHDDACRGDVTMDELLPFEEYDKFSEAAKSAYDMDWFCGILVELGRPHAPTGARIRVKDIRDKESGHPTIVFGITEGRAGTS